MKITGKFVACFLVLWGLMFGDAMADTVHVKNGDRLTGEVIALEKEKLHFKTTYAGNIFLSWSEVENISVDKPVNVLLKDGVSVQGVIERTEDGRIAIMLDKPRQQIRLSLAEIEGINPKQAETAKTKVGVQANIGIKTESGNTEKDTVHLDGRLTASKQPHRFALGLEYDYETSDNKKTKNKLLTFSKVDYFFRYPWYVYGKGAYEFDEFKDLNLKLDIGPGIGYQFVENESANLSLETGPSFVRQDFKGESQRDYIAARAAIKSDKWFFDNLFQFYFNAEGFSNPSKQDDRFARARTGLRFPLGAGFNLTTQYNLDWDGNPPEGVDETDQKFIFTLGYIKD